MDWEDVMVFLIVVLPVASLCFGLTLRLAVKPFVETLSRALSESKVLPPPRPPRDELLELREQLHGLVESVDDLKRKIEFDRQLGAGAPE